MTRNIKSKYLVLLLITCLYTHIAVAQSLMLSKDELMSIVRAYHPVVKQAQLRVDRANAEVQGARGAFDPLLNTTLRQKTLDGKQYYSYFTPELTIPTWYGVELKGGIESAEGYRLNPETTTGDLGYLGVKVPLNSLLYDKRRATLQQAKAYATASDFDRLLSINNIFYDALSAYWNWTRDYEIYTNIQSLIKTNTERIKFVKIEAEQGNKPAIDTTEAIAQYQVLMQQQNAALLAWQMSGIELSAFLWQKDGEPSQLAVTVVPDTTSLDKYDQQLPNIDSLLATTGNHPKLLSMQNKLDVLELERKLKRQYLAPKLSVNAGIISKDYFAKNFDPYYIDKNNKIGLDFSVPLFLREARSGVKIANFKIQEMKLDISQTEIQIQNKVKSTYAEVLSLRAQIIDYDKAYIAYTVLYKGESQRFRAGESTLFLLNSRESKVLEALQKLIELKAKYQKSSAALSSAIASLK
ncbi:MAG: TolC family protein [Taibaiella sp.]|nr:TolC family protein [Taibaiella sp.]